MVHALEPAIDDHHVKGFSEQTGELVQQPAVDTHEFDLGRLTEPSQVQSFSRFERRQPTSFVARRRYRGAEFRERIGKQLPDDQRRGDLECGGTAHAGPDGDGAVNGRVEPAEVHATFAQLDQHAFDIIRPGRGGIVFEFADPENFARGIRG